jgi:hypothetical protein
VDYKQPRSNRGQFIRTTTSAERDADAARLRDTGMGYKEIAEQLGYCDKGQAWRGVQRTLTEIVREPAEKLRQTEANRLDDLYVDALNILERDHVMVSHGKIVYGEDGRALLDDGPKIAAIRELRQIRESYRKLFGADAAKQIDIALEQRIDLDAQLVTDALTAALDAIDLTDEQRAVALGAAQQRLQEAD